MKGVSGPLEGLKVLDLGIVGAGPIGPTLLAELGADVIKVEMPGRGDILRRIPPLYNGVGFWKPIEMRNKKSIEVDLHTKEGQELIKRMVREYNIVLENYRPGTLERWNLSYEDLKRANDKVILVRVSGFGSGGPYSNRTSYDTIGAAMGGIIYLNGYPDGPPLPLGNAYCDYMSAAFNALAMLIADYYRRRKGQGQWAEVTQYAAILRILEYTVAAYDKLGLVRNRTGNRHPSFAPCDIFRTRDGKWITITAGDDKSFANLIRAMKMEELRDDPRFKSISSRAENGETINALVAGWVEGYEFEELKGVMNREGVPFSHVNSTKDIFEDPHCQARQNIIEAEDSVIGKVKLPMVVPKFAKTPGIIKNTGAELGKDNEEIESILGSLSLDLKFDKDPITPQEDEALKDLRVLDVGMGLAGSFCSALLADFGAEVIKVEEPGKGDILRKIPPFYNGSSLWWAVDGRNKKSVTIDLRTKEGQRIFKDLVKIFDVVVEGFRPGTLERWGVGYDDLRRINEKIILLRISGFGQYGPYSKRAAYDAEAAAMGGFTYIAGSPDRPPLKPSISIANYLTGLFGAIAIMAAIHHRDHRGEGQWIDLALYEPFIRFSQEIIPVFDKLGTIRERLGNKFPTSGAQLYFEAGDGEWCAILVAEDKDFQRLCCAMNREDLVKDPRFQTLLSRNQNRDELNNIIASWTKRLNSKELVEILVKNQVPTSLTYSIKDIFEDPHYKAKGDIVEVEDPIIGKVKMQGVTPRFSLTPGSVKKTGPRLGEHNDEILRALLGISDEDFSKLQSEAII